MLVRTQTEGFKCLYNLGASREDAGKNNLSATALIRYGTYGTLLMMLSLMIDYHNQTAVNSLFSNTVMRRY